MTEYGYTFDYSRTMMMKLFLASPNVRDGGSHVNCTFAEALDVIRMTDALTLGVPKIIYLVGWQYDGHDDKYPAFFEVNRALKRDCDETALDSLLWLIEAAKEYHTTVSLHINFCDIYEDSPLWNTYVANGAVIRDKNGNPDPIENYNGKPCYKVSFKEEWETGLFRERFGRLCDMIPLTELGTVHVDNFLCCYNNCPEVDIAEMQDYRDRIVDYVHGLGIDITSEFTYREGPLGRDTYSHWCMGTTMYPIRCLGRIPALWWFDNLTDEEYIKYPPAYFGGGISHDPAFLHVFYGNMHGEDIWFGENLHSGAWTEEFLRQFCMIQLPYFWLCRHDRLRVENHDDGTKTAYFSDGIVCRGQDVSITQNGHVLKTESYVSLPAVWMDDAFVVYSTADTELIVHLPGAADREYTVWRITPDGLTETGCITVTGETAVLTLRAGEALLLK